MRGVGVAGNLIFVAVRTTYYRRNCTAANSLGVMGTLCIQYAPMCGEILSLLEHLYARGRENSPADPSGNHVCRFQPQSTCASELS